jgi:hypothetical protein
MGVKVVGNVEAEAWPKQSWAKDATAAFLPELKGVVIKLTLVMACTYHDTHTEVGKHPLSVAALVQGQEHSCCEHPESSQIHPFKECGLIAILTLFRFV